MQRGHRVQDEQLSWYVRHRVCDEETGVTLGQQAAEREAFVKKEDIFGDTAECMGCLFEGDDADY